MDRMRESEEISQEDVRMAHGHRQQCGEGQREGWVGSGWRGAEEAKMEDIVIVSTIKKKEKKKIYT